MAITWLKRGRADAEPAAATKSVLTDIVASGVTVLRDLSVKLVRYDPPAFRLPSSESEAAKQKVAALCILSGFVGHAEQCNIRVRRYGGRNVAYGTAAE